MAYGQNDCFLKKLWPKSQNILTMVVSTFIGVSNCSEGSRPIVFAKNMSFCQRSKFYPKTAILAGKLKLLVTTCLYLF